MSIMMMANSFVPIGLIPISALAEYAGIDLALMLSGTLVGISLLLLQFWKPALHSIGDASARV